MTSGDIPARLFHHKVDPGEMDPATADIARELHRDCGRPGCRVKERLHLMAVAEVMPGAHHVTG